DRRTSDRRRREPDVTTLEPRINIERAVAHSAVQRKTLEHVWGFDDVAIVPGAVTTNPELVELNLRLGERDFGLPILASSMDAVVDVDFRAALAGAGGPGVLP